MIGDNMSGFGGPILLSKGLKGVSKNACVYQQQGENLLLGIQSLLHGLLSELLLLSLLQLFELKKEFNFWEFEFLGRAKIWY